MSHLMVYVKTFNDTLFELYTFLERTFPELATDVLFTKGLTKFLMTQNPRNVPDQFWAMTSPYYDKIMNCDESFFLNFENNIDMQTENILYGMKLVHIWSSKSTSDINKMHIWYYFQKLLKLSKKIQIL